MLFDDAPKANQNNFSPQPANLPDYNDPSEPKGFDAEFSQDDDSKQRSIEAYIEFLDNGASDPQTQLSLQDAYEEARAKFDPINLDDKFATYLIIDNKVRDLRDTVRKSFEKHKLRLFPNMKWWFFDRSVFLWCMHLGLSAGCPNFMVPKAFKDRSDINNFYDLVYKYMLSSPSRAGILARRDPDEVAFLKLAMRSLVVDATIRSSLVGLKVPVINNIKFDDAKNEITCESIQREVSGGLKQFVYYNVNWSQTQQLSKFAKLCKPCLASQADPTKAKLNWLKDCPDCFKENAKEEESGTYEENLHAMRLLRMLAVSNFLTSPFPQIAQASFRGCKGLRFYLMKKLNVQGFAEAVERISSQKTNKAIYDWLANNAESAQFFVDALGEVEKPSNLIQLYVQFPEKLSKVL